MTDTEDLIMTMTRRDVLRLALHDRRAGRACARRSARAAAPPRPLPDATPKHLPRWRGFNLLDKFMVDQQKPFEERDFADIAELGFDFVRLPLDYRCWTDRDKPEDAQGAGPQGDRPGGRVRPQAWRSRPDQLPPGARVSPSPSPPEPKSLWTDPEIQDVCAHHWASLRGALPGHARTTWSASTRSTSPTTRSSRRTTAAWSSASPAAIRERDPEAADRLRRPCLGHRARRPS